MILDPLYELGPLESREDSLAEAKCMEHFTSRIPHVPNASPNVPSGLAMASHWCQARGSCVTPGEEIKTSKGQDQKGGSGAS
ncbi:unnamed protein product [Caretta caretta]